MRDTETDRKTQRDRDREGGDGYRRRKRFTEKEKHSFNNRKMGIWEERKGQVHIELMVACEIAIVTNVYGVLFVLVQSTFHATSHLIFRTILKYKYIYFYFSHNKLDAQRSYTKCPRSQLLTLVEERILSGEIRT